MGVLRMRSQVPRQSAKAVRLACMPKAPAGGRPARPTSPDSTCGGSGSGSGSGGSGGGGDSLQVSLQALQSGPSSAELAESPTACRASVSWHQLWLDERGMGMQRLQWLQIRLTSRMKFGLCWTLASASSSCGSSVPCASERRQR